MSRTTVAWIAIGLMAAAGCRMCASPYDYCSPTFMGTCGDDCAAFVRAGSILSAPVEEGPVIASEGYVHHQAAEVQEIARIQVDYRSASPILAAVAEEKSQAAPQTGPALAVEEPPALAIEQGPKLAVEQGPKLAVEFAEAPSDGWRAKR